MVGNFILDSHSQYLCEEGTNSLSRNAPKKYKVLILVIISWLNGHKV